MGCPAALSKKQQDEVKQQLAQRASVASLAEQYGTSRQTVMRGRDTVQGLIDQELFADLTLCLSIHKNTRTGNAIRDRPPPFRIDRRIGSRPPHDRL